MTNYTTPQTVNFDSEVLTDNGISKFYVFWIEVTNMFGEKINLPLSGQDLLLIFDKSKIPNPDRTIGTYYRHNDFYNFSSKTNTRFMTIHFMLGYSPKTFGEFVQYELELKRKSFLSKFYHRRLIPNGDGTYTLNYRGHILSNVNVYIRYGRANSKNVPFQSNIKEIHKFRHTNKSWGSGSNSSVSCVWSSKINDLIIPKKS